MNASTAAHPRDVLQGAQAGAFLLPVVDHYSGVEARMRKSLQLQAEWIERTGACVFDVTLDCEDGAPVGGEASHAALVSELVRGAAPTARVAVRVHPVDHPAFAADVAAIVAAVGDRLCHVMVPKVEQVSDVDRAVRAVDAALAAGAHQRAEPLPLQVLIESPAAVQRAFDIAAHPRVQSISFGLMDFVSAHGGAIPAAGMGLQGQFSHPLVVRAKLEIASACHAHGKVPSHCVITEFDDAQALGEAARRAAREFGYTRMWSIHPAQIEPLLAALSPQADEIDQAAELLLAAEAAQWAPIRFDKRLQDRASYRYHWQVLERAHRSGRPLPDRVRRWFTPTA